jgi:hypothetical protein
MSQENNYYYYYDDDDDDDGYKNNNKNNHLSVPLPYRLLESRTRNDAAIPPRCATPTGSGDRSRLRVNAKQ